MYVAHSHRWHLPTDDLLIPLNQANGIIDVDQLQSHGIPASAMDASIADRNGQVSAQATSTN